MSIGGNHLIHALRRNVDIRVVLLNNRIYGLTKGQASPTAALGTVSKPSPLGTVEVPIDPLGIALAAGASFVARLTNASPEHLKATLRRAAEHRGNAFVEVCQDCRVFNDGIWREVVEPDVRDERTLALWHGQAMVFGRAWERESSFVASDQRSSNWAVM